MLKGLGNLGNIGAIVKQAQEMGAKMQAAQAQLRAVRVTGSAVGGMVEVDANGLGEVLAVRIEPEFFAKQDREMLEDLLPSAVNAALAKAKEAQANAMQEAAGGLNLPGLGDALNKFTGGAIE
jgi:nucleoid-associated protein EbfC